MGPASACRCGGWFGCCGVVVVVWLLWCGGFVFGVVWLCLL